MAQEGVCEMINTVPFRLGKCLAAIGVLWLWPHAPVLAVGAVPLKAAPITLAWESANDPAVQGYGIYYGLTNQPANNYVNAGTNLFVKLFDLRADTGYQFYAVSYDAAGNESVPSNQLRLTPPVMSRVRIARLATGDFRIALRAAPGSVCQVEYADSPDRSPWEPLGLATADANGNVTILDSASPPRPARFYRAVQLVNSPFTRLELAKQADGAMRITLNGSPHSTWNIQYAKPANSPQWTTIATVTANATGNAVVTNLPRSEVISRFYRAALQ